MDGNRHTHVSFVVDGIKHNVSCCDVMQVMSVMLTVKLTYHCSSISTDIMHRKITASKKTMCLPAALCLRFLKEKTRTRMRQLYLAQVLWTITQAAHPVPAGMLVATQHSKPGTNTRNINKNAPIVII